MKPIIAYLLVIFGAPVAFGGFATLPFSVLLKHLPEFIQELFEGIINMFLAYLIFFLLKVDFTLYVLIAQSIVTIAFLSARKEPSPIIPQILGNTAAWFFIAYYLH